MHQKPHEEHHFLGSESVRDVVIGMADGLTVPFALAAGISGAIAGTHLVVTAGLAEIAAGSIAMGLGGYLAAKSEREHYESELKREELEIIERPKDEEDEVTEILVQYGLTTDEAAQVMRGLKARPVAWRDFMMRFELGLEAPDPKRAFVSAVTIAGSYIVGGFIPLFPYMIFNESNQALELSIVVTLIALLIFGYVKGKYTGVKPIKSALQTTGVGGVAAAVAYFLAQAIS